MSKTNDIAKATRAHQDVIRQGLPANHPTRVAVKARLDRLTGEQDPLGLAAAFGGDKVRELQQADQARKDRAFSERLERIEAWGRSLHAQGKHPMGSYRLGSLEDQAARRGFFAAQRKALIAA